MNTFKLTYVNPSRRDLLKHLAALGVLGTGSILSSPLLAADIAATNRESLELNARWREDPDYEGVRKAMLWRSNTPERYPDVIAHAGSEQEITEALKFAADHDLQVVCRGSGHNTAGAILRNGGMMLDVSGRKQVEIDAANKTASVQPGALMAQLSQLLAEYQLAFPTAYCHTVSLGGYLLGGGHGSNGQHWGHGPACYSVLDADVILADGEKVTVSKDSHPDVFWAIRGVGPGFFGVITRLTLQAYDQPALILSNNYVHSPDALPEVIALFDGLQNQKDERVNISITLMPGIETGDELVASVTITAFADPGGDPESEARSLLAPYQQNGVATGVLSSEEYKEVPLASQMFTPDRNERANVDNIFTDDPGALTALVEHAKNRPPNSAMYMNLQHSVQMFPFREDACYSAAGRHWLSTRLKWYDPNDDAANYTWYREFNKITAPYALSHYINETDNENHPERVRDCFSEENWKKLAEVRGKYDPQSRFYSYLGNP